MLRRWREYVLFAAHGKLWGKGLHGLVQRGRQMTSLMVKMHQEQQWRSLGHTPEKMLQRDFSPCVAESLGAKLIISFPAAPRWVLEETVGGISRSILLQLIAWYWAKYSVLLSKIRKGELPASNLRTVLSSKRRRVETAPRSQITTAAAVKSERTGSVDHYQVPFGGIKQARSETTCFPEQEGALRGNPAADPGVPWIRSTSGLSKAPVGGMSNSPRLVSAVGMTGACWSGAWGFWWDVRAAVPPWPRPASLSKGCFSVSVFILLFLFGL